MKDELKRSSFSKSDQHLSDRELVGKSRVKSREGRVKLKETDRKLLNNPYEMNLFEEESMYGIHDEVKDED